MNEKYSKISFLFLIFIVKITTLAAAAALTQQGTGTGESSSSSSSSIVSWSPSDDDIDNMNNVDLDMDMMSTTISSSHHRQLKSNKHHYYKKRHKKRKHSKKLKKGIGKKKAVAEAAVMDKYCLVKRKKKKKRNTNNAAVFVGSLTTEGVSTENTDYTSETMRSNVNNNNNIDSSGQTAFEDDLIVDLFAPDGLDSLDMDMYDEVVVDRQYYNKKTKKIKRKKKKVSSSSSLQCAQKGKKIYVEEEFTFIVNLHVDSLPFGKTMMDLYNKQVSESILMERTNALSRCYYYLQPQQSLTTETTTDVVANAAVGSDDMSDGETHQPNGYGKHDSQIVFQKVELISETKLSNDDGTQQRQRQLLLSPSQLRKGKSRRTQNEQEEEETRKSITRLDYKFSGITITPVDLPTDEYPCIECVIGDSIVRDVRRRRRHLLINQNLLPLQEQPQSKIIEQTCQEFSNRGSLEEEFIQTENPTFTQIDRIYLEKVSNCVSDYSTCVSHFPSFMTGQEFCYGVNLNIGCPVTCCCHYEIDTMENKACKNYFDSCWSATSSSSTTMEANARHHDTEATCPLYEQDDASKKEKETDDFVDFDFDSFITMGGRYYSIVDADAPFEFGL